MRSTETVLLTTDLQIAHVVSNAIPWEQIDWQQSFSSVLTAITPDTKTLIVDASTDGMMAHLLAMLFLDQRPGRRAVVIDATGGPARDVTDPRVSVVAGPVTPDAVTEALVQSADLAAACEDFTSALASAAA